MTLPDFDFEVSRFEPPATATAATTATESGKCSNCSDCSSSTEPEFYFGPSPARVAAVPSSRSRAVPGDVLPPNRDHWPPKARDQFWQAVKWLNKAAREQGGVALDGRSPTALDDAERAIREAWAERFEERAAVREFDGGFPRAEAERLAFGDLELRPGPRPV